MTTGHANTPAEEPADVLLYVQHLLGIGHLRRAAVIARALDRIGLTVVLVTGGIPVPGLDLGGLRVVQLPPVKARDETFSVLVDQSDRPIDEAWKAARAARLRASCREVKPKALLIEMFPFGRRQMRFELLPLLDAAQAARPRPRILCSLRDVLTAQGSPEKTGWSLDTFKRYFDLVLVHGDPDILPLTRSFPRAAEIADRTRYTGYIVDPAHPAQGADPAHPAVDANPAGRGEVIVSTGGGAVAGPLIEAALGARARTPLAEATWRILVGHNLPEARFRDFRRRAPSGVVVERSRPDFPHLLARGRLSISQAGYNTIMDVLAAGIPAVVVPFAAQGETEQSVRARLLRAHGALTLVEEAELSSETLAAAVRRALARGSAKPGRLRGVQTDGADKTAEIIRDLVAIVTP